jgi:rsbT co-antagonist protein RsbR
MPAASISYVLIATMGHMFLGDRDSRWITVVCVLAFAADVILLNTWSTGFPPLEQTFRLVTGAVIGPFILTLAILVIRSITIEREKATRQAQLANLEIARHEQAEAQRAQVEAERERLRQQVLDAQREIIRELSTPIIPIMETPRGGIIVMPLVGRIDGRRATDITRRLLIGIREHRAKIVILDITGVPIVDSDVASRLHKTIHAARLKGAHTIITGISDVMAEIIIDLGIDWSGVETVSDLQGGLLAALDRLGQQVVG